MLNDMSSEKALNATLRGRGSQRPGRFDLPLRVDTSSHRLAADGKRNLCGQGEAEVFRRNPMGLLQDSQPTQFMEEVNHDSFG